MINELNKFAYFDKECWRALVDRLQTQNYALHLLIEIVCRINPNEDNKKQLDEIRVDLNELCKIMNLYGQNKLSIIKKSIKKIYATTIDFENSKEWQAIPFLNPYKTKIRHNEVIFSISEQFYPYLVDLNKFLKLKRSVLRLSNRALIFYTYLKSIHNKNIYPISYSNLSQALNISYEYKNFKQKYLKPVIEELGDNGIKIQYKETTGRYHKVESISFFITEDENNEELSQLNEIQQSEKVTITESKSDLVNQVPDVRKTIKKPFEAEIKEVYDHYMTVFHRDNRYTLTPDRQAVIRARLEEKFTVEELKKHIDLHKKSDFHNGVNDQKKFYIDLKEHIFNKTKFDIRQQNIEVVKPKSTYQKPVFSDSEVNNDVQVVDSIDFIFFVEKYYINNHNEAYRSYRKTAETFPEFWLRTMSLRR